MSALIRSCSRSLLTKNSTNGSRRVLISTNSYSRAMGNSSGTGAINAGSGAVGKATASSDIVLFNMNGCPYCRNAITSIKTAGYGDKLTVIEATDEHRDELYQLTKVTSLPSVWIKGRYVGGCNDGPEPWMGIKKIIDSGKLNEYLE
jgi:glutaredoxin